MLRTMGSRLDWNYTANLGVDNRTGPVSRGFVLGGSSATSEYSQKSQMSQLLIVLKMVWSTPGAHLMTGTGMQTLPETMAGLGITCRNTSERCERSSFPKMWHLIVGRRTKCLLDPQITIIHLGSLTQVYMVFTASTQSPFLLMFIDSMI
jgi:hypothetical protein